MSQAQLPRDVTALSGLGPPISASNRAPQTCAGQAGGGNSSAEVPSSQGCRQLKLTVTVLYF